MSYFLYLELEEKFRFETLFVLTLTVRKYLFKSQGFHELFNVLTARRYILNIIFT